MTYYYEFKYKVDDTVLKMRFSAAINIHTLKKNLEQFLKGCSWHEETIRQLWVEEKDNNLDGN